MVQTSSTGARSAAPQAHFTETHHALLFAWIARALVERAGEERGQAIVRKATCRYGEERGHRMALRVRADGHALNMANYLAYSEYRLGRGQFDAKLVARTPHVRIAVSRCPWHTAWLQHGLMPLGRLYCHDVDQALVRGFNPDLRLDVIATLADGAPLCESVYHDAHLTLANALVYYYRRLVRPGVGAAMPWDYHVAHLFATLAKVAVEELGDLGQQAVDAGLAEFAACYGEGARQKVVAGRDVDYTRLPVH